MGLVIDNRCVYEDCIFENPLWEEILDVLENNGFIVDEEIDKIYIRKEKEVVLYNRKIYIPN